jgi:RimJ/RimL family protein N-acetyltransferase
MMEIRQTAVRELDAVLGIYESARIFMRQSGNQTQWTNGYPGRDILLEDIKNGSSYVCYDIGADGRAAGEITGVFSLVFGEDPTYRKIRGGGWLNDRPYGTVHRLAVRIHGRGVAPFCLDWCFRQCRNLRVDTHEDNIPMQRLLKREGFLPCGVITLPDGSPRLAYQKTGG